VEHAAGIAETAPHETLDELVARLAADLADRGSRRDARRFHDVVGRARAAEAAITSADRAVDEQATNEPFTTAVACHLHKLMAYKDEYEVARLLLLEQSRAGYRAVGGERTKVTYHLHPPMLRSMGLQRKLRFRRSAPLVMRALRAAAPVRGTLLDPFRWAKVRRVERAMIPEYVDAVERLVAHLGAGNVEEATRIASLPDQVRGFEDLKLRRAAAYRDELALRIAAFDGVQPSVHT
jgi:indolepyruvate ferredoxin oxidoreductase